VTVLRLSRPSQPDQHIGTTYALEWYLACMSVTASVVLGDKGRVVVPAAIRERRNWAQGTTLLLIETPDGMLLTDRATALKGVREQLRGQPLVDELLAERRAEAAADSVGD
jgi:AbrB family looped-hinge helix DNA binding protein